MTIDDLIMDHEVTDLEHPPQSFLYALAAKLGEEYQHDMMEIFDTLDDIDVMYREYLRSMADHQDNEVCNSIKARLQASFFKALDEKALKNAADYWRDEWVNYRPYPRLRRVV